MVYQNIMLESRPAILAKSTVWRHLLLPDLSSSCANSAAFVLSICMWGHSVGGHMKEPETNVDWTCL